MLYIYLHVLRRASKCRCKIGCYYFCSSVCSDEGYINSFAHIVHCWRFLTSGTWRRVICAILRTFRRTHFYDCIVVVKSYFYKCCLNKIQSRTTKTVWRRTVMLRSDVDIWYLGCLLNIRGINPCTGLGVLVCIAPKNWCQCDENCTSYGQCKSQQVANLKRKSSHSA